MSDPTNLLDELNEAQRQAVTHEGGPLLIVAGAGTGKTTVLTRRYQNLLAKPGLTTQSILALTFTEKAAGEMEDRVLALLPVGAYDFWISTFHGFCQRVLQDHALEIGLSTPFRLLTPTDAWLMLRRRLAELPLEAYKPLGNPTKFLRAMVQHISRAKDEGVTPEDYQAFAKKAEEKGEEPAEQARLKELAEVYFVYRSMLREEGALDFGDLILETLRLFRERPKILEAYRTQFQYVLVDEFQDTNWAQYELVKLLAGEKKNLTVVGDDDQAIYKFRGASLANILQFRDDFPEAVTVALTKNYRSKKEILDVAYASIKKNDPNRLEVKLASTGLTKKLEAERGEGGATELIWARTVEQEADRVVEQIERLKRIDPEATWNDFAILVRSNDGAEPFVRALEHARIPFQFMALRGLYAKPVIIDIVCLLTMLDTRHESPILWRALTLDCYRLPVADMAELLADAHKKGRTLWHTVCEAASKNELPITERGRKMLQGFIEDIEGLAELAHRAPPFQAFQMTLEKTGFLSQILSLNERDRQETLRHIASFADRIRRYEQVSHGATLHGFLEEYRLEIESGEEGALEMDPEAEGPDMVKILTVHAAKGLEYRFVFVVSLVDQRFPTRARSESVPLPDGLIQERLPEGNPHLEEERRLFYVALTRAKERLFLTGSYEYGGARDKKPSAFLTELEMTPSPKEALQKRELVELIGKTPAIEGVTGETDLVLYPLKRRFSFTQLAAFKKCPLQYKYAHIYRIPTTGSHQRSFGQSIHLTFQKMFQLHQARLVAEQGSLFEALPLGLTSGGWMVTEEEALALYEETWIDEWYPDRTAHDTYWAEGKLAVKRFQAHWSAQVPNPIELEKEFVLQIGGHSIKGKIDRVDQNGDGTVTIVDYKTGQAKEKLEAEDKEQLYLYQLALEGRGFKISRMCYVYVLDGTELDVELLEDGAKDQFLLKMEERMDAILHSKFEATPEPFVCKHCDFRQVCPFRKLS